MACELLSESSAKALVEGIDNVLFDCDGVLWDGRGVIPGSLETVMKLKKLGKRVFYITNNSSKSRADYVERCQKLGFPATKEDVVCTSYLAALYLHNLQFKHKVYVIGNPAMATELDAYGIRHCGIGPDPLQGCVDDWLQTELDPEVKCVLVGFDSHLSYMKIMKASSYLQQPDCLFVATNTDSHLPVKESHIRIPGTGTMVHAVKVPAEREPVVLGKPEPSMFEELRKLHNLDPARCLMVGDRINTDIAMAKSCKLKSLLVLTGVSKQSELPLPGSLQNGNSENGADNSPIIPDLYSACLGDLGKFI